MNKQHLIEELDRLSTELFPIHRSILGDGTEQTLDILKRELPQMTKYKVPSEQKVFDWEIPKKWTVHCAYIKRKSDGVKIVDFDVNNLHLVQYSCRCWVQDICKEGLSKYVHTLPEQPDAIPYMTSYYNQTWGFCMSHNQWLELSDTDTYDVYIDTSFKDDFLSYGEICIPGKTSDTILISTYICHPSLANDNLSGILLAIFLTKRLLEQIDLHYSYRIVFLPETIGSIAYIATRLKPEKVNIVGGYVITCVGKDGSYTYIQTRKPSITDKITKFVLDLLVDKSDISIRDFTECGSDERQYNFPGVDYPIGSITRAKYAEYPEYHTSLDCENDFYIIASTLEMYMKCLEVFEMNHRYKCTTICEPHMRKYDLYPRESVAGSNASRERVSSRLLMNILRYSDGDMDLIDLSKKLNESIWNLNNLVRILKESNLLVNTAFAEV